MNQVAIIGKGSGWELAPVRGNSWGITQLVLRRQVSLVIDMNVYSDGRWGEDEARQARLARELCEKIHIPYVCPKNYPLQQIMDRFQTDYFSNTVDYALALAIHYDYTLIDLYGVNMATASEWAYQKSGVDFWCGVAIGAGRKVRVFGEQSRIMKTSDGLLYGYDIPQKILH
jgi:hypothetical protein